MCIIAVKPKEIKLPSMEILSRNMDSNQHGTGFVVSRGNKQLIHKGFWKFPEFYADLLATVDEDDACIIHSRIATSGRMDVANCHPFPMTREANKLEEPELLTSLPVVAHNGIIAGYGNKRWSDTYDFIMEVLADPLIKNNLDNHAIRQLIGEAVGFSKLAFMTKGKILLVGEFESDKGILYSNGGYKYPKIPSYLEGYGYSPKEYAEELDREESYRGMGEDVTYDSTLDQYYGFCEVCGEYTDNLIPTVEGYICQSCLDFMEKDEYPIERLYKGKGK